MPDPRHVAAWFVKLQQFIQSKSGGQKVASPNNNKFQSAAVSLQLLLLQYYYNYSLLEKNKNKTEMCSCIIARRHVAAGT